jgi:redox-sensitive bicupin YhaK (pirin superfamily)
MITVRRGADRGHVKHNWLESYHTFSFSSYQDPAHNGFRALRVLNDDVVAAGRGFGAHAHRDMEILSYVLDGKLKHKDSMGNVQLMGPNEIQKMSAGAGVIHSEFNGSEDASAHFLQIWIEPAKTGTPPTYEQYQFEPEEKRGRWKMLASNRPEPGAVSIQQDAQVFLTELAPKGAIAKALAENRAAWVHVVSGEVTVNGTALGSGDAAAVTGEAEVQLAAGSEGVEVVFFDLA